MLLSTRLLISADPVRTIFILPAAGFSALIYLVLRWAVRRTGFLLESCIEIIRLVRVISESMWRALSAIRHYRSNALQIWILLVRCRAFGRLAVLWNRPAIRRQTSRARILCELSSSCEHSTLSESQEACRINTQGFKIVMSISALSYYLKKNFSPFN